MKATITHTERLRLTELLRDAQQRLAGVDDIQRRIALMLGMTSMDDACWDAITDAVGGVLTVDALLSMLTIGVEEKPA